MGSATDTIAEAQTRAKPNMVGPIDFAKLYTHPLARQFHEAIQTVDNLGCDSTAAVNKLHALSEAVEQEINRLCAPPDGEVTEDMLNEGQERMCQMASRTVFEDHIQAGIYKAMRDAEHQARVDRFSVIGADWAEPNYGNSPQSTAMDTYRYGDTAPKSSGASE